MTDCHVCHYRRDACVGTYSSDPRTCPFGITPRMTPLYSDRCSRHSHDLEPGNCGACKDVRVANAARPHLAGEVRVHWHEDLQGTNCDRCHPVRNPDAGHPRGQGGGGR